MSDVLFILDERTGVIEIVDLQRGDKTPQQKYLDDCAADRRNAEC